MSDEQLELTFNHDRDHRLRNRKLRKTLAGTRIFLRLINPTIVRTGGDVRAKLISTFVVCLMATSMCFASSDAEMGTWKLNPAKSKLGAGVPKNDTVTYEAAGDSVKVTIDGTAPDGTPTHSEWTGKFDGKDYPSTGNPGEDTRSYKQLDDRTLQFASKKGGKVVLAGRIAVSADGKSRTVTATGTDAQGKKTSGTAVYR